MSCNWNTVSLLPSGFTVHMSVLYPLYWCVYSIHCPILYKQTVKRRKQLQQHCFGFSTGPSYSTFYSPPIAHTRCWVKSWIDRHMRPWPSGRKHSCKLSKFQCKLTKHLYKLSKHKFKLTEHVNKYANFPLIKESKQNIHANIPNINANLLNIHANFPILNPYLHTEHLVTRKIAGRIYTYREK